MRSLPNDKIATGVDIAIANNVDEIVDASANVIEYAIRYCIGEYSCDGENVDTILNRVGV